MKLYEGFDPDQDFLKKGNYHPSTNPFWTNQVNFRFERTVFVMAKRAYSQM